MCGIAGILDFRSGSIDEAGLRRACDLMVHRGPDDRGTLVDAGGGLSVGLAAVRLAVVDPTPAGHQPMRIGGDRYLLVYNGELYNFRELRGELARAGWSFQTNTDTEVVGAACAHWGPQALARFNGMFALAFFDRRERRGFLARDRFGIKPLLVAEGADHVHFASEMAGLQAFAGWDRALDRGALLHYLHFGYFAAPDSIYARVRRIPPGAYAAFDAQGLKAPVAYSAEAAPAGIPTYGDACAAVRTALYTAVARQRVADVPLGTFLSGGIDSSIIALHLAECTAGPIETFAIGFREHARYDETRYARRMAAELGSRHHELRLSFDDVIEALPGILDHLGEPFFDSSIVPTAIVSRLARQHVTVCLSGDGGDELFGGYWRYLGHDAAASYRRLPRWLRTRVIDPLLRRGGGSKSSGWSNRVRQLRKLLRGVDESPIGRHLQWSMLIDRSSLQILREPGAGGVLLAAAAEFERTTAHLRGADPLNRILAYDVRSSLPGDMLHKVDLASMRHSLEVRVPFLDPDVVALAERCPAAYKVDRGLRKRLLVDAYRGRIPDAILDREKAGFELPIGEFLRNRLRDMFLATVTRERIESFEVLDYAGVMRVYDDHCARRGEHADLLFALLSLCWWRSQG